MTDSTSSPGGITWLNTKTPSNYRSPRDRENAQTIAINANLHGRYRNRQTVSHELPSHLRRERHPRPVRFDTPSTTGLKFRSRGIGYSYTDISHRAKATHTKRQSLRCRQPGCTHAHCAEPYRGLTAYDDGSDFLEIGSSEEDSSDSPRRSSTSSASSSTELTLTASDYSPFLRTDTPDPFRSTPIPLNGRRLKVITHIRSLSVFVNWSAELTTPPGRRHMIAAFWAQSQAYFESEVVMHGYMAFAYSLMALVHPREKEVFHRECSNHITRAVFLLRGLVENPSEPTNDRLTTILHAVTCLTIAEFYRARFQASAMHRHALKQIILLLGGLDKLHWIFKEMLVHYFTSTFALLQEKSELPLHFFDPGPLSLEDTPSLTATTTPSGASPPAPTPPPNHAPELTQILFLFRELIPLESLKRQPSTPTTLAEYTSLQPLFRHSYLRRAALRTMIADHWYQLAVVTNSIDPIDDENLFAQRTLHKVTLDMCLCLAAHLLFYLIFLRELLHLQAHGGFQFLRVLLRRCVAKLEIDPATVEARHINREDLLWVLSIGAHAEDVTSQNRAGGVTQKNAKGEEREDSDQPRWFSTRFAVLARRMGYTTSAQLVRLFEIVYVYDPSTMAEVLGRLIDFKW